MVPSKVYLKWHFQSKSMTAAIEKKIRKDLYLILKYQNSKQAFQFEVFQAEVFISFIF